MYEAGAETPKVFSRGGGIKALEGVEQSYCQTGELAACRHHDPSAFRVTKSNRNFAWEDLNEHQAEEEFSLQQKTRFGQLKPSPAD